MIVFVTERLILRQMSLQDAGFFVGLWSDPEAARFIGGVKTPEQILVKIEDAVEHQRKHGFSRWSVTLKATGELIGLCGPMIRQIDGTAETELGYAFGRPFWGQGFATEASKAALDHCLGALHQTRVVAIIDPGNHASIRVAEKNRMVFERMIDWQEDRVRLYALDGMKRSRQA